MIFHLGLGFTSNEFTVFPYVSKTYRGALSYEITWFGFWVELVISKDEVEIQVDGELLEGNFDVTEPFEIGTDKPINLLQLDETIFDD